MTARRPAPTAEELDRAVKMSRLPMMRLGEVCQRTGLSMAQLRRARKERPARLDRDDLVLAGLTMNGTRPEGEVGDLGLLASWLDYVNKDGSTALAVQRDLERLAAAGRLVLSDGRYRLVGRWP